MRRLLLFLLCLTQTGCISGLLWSAYRPVEEDEGSSYLEAALDPSPGPPRLLVACVFTGGESAVVALTPPYQKLEILPPTALVDPVPLAPEEPVTLGDFQLLLRSTGRLEVSGVAWEWRLPEEEDGTRASGVRDLGLGWSFRGEETAVLAELWYGAGHSRYVRIADSLVRFDTQPTSVPKPSLLVARVRDRGAHATLEIEGATRILARPVRTHYWPNGPQLAGRILLIPFALALDGLTLPFQIPAWIYFAYNPIFIDSPRVPPRPAASSPDR